ncbi:MAG: methylated-DNA--[protein]-cysteine S-methyltransferase, partial [Streptomycetaceae bacterium]|nr:methylated-DNA--[protein]-cysteine S-methyltransferase [Streptomycetaceae bacterium]
MHTFIDSPIGTLLATADERGRLTGLHMQDGRHPAPVPSEGRRDDSAFAELRTQLAEYFAGHRREFSLELAPAGGEFERRVWAALREIPYGETASYGEIARRIGAPG